MAREAGHSLWSPGVTGCSYFRGSRLGDTREWGFPWGLVTWQPLPSIRATIPASQEEGRCFAETTRLHAQLRHGEPLLSGSGPESQVPEVAEGPREQAFLQMSAG